MRARRCRGVPELIRINFNGCPRNRSQKSCSFPKTVALGKYLFSLIDDRQCLVLDSFAGSGTTAQAVLELNAIDGGTRRFLLVEVVADIAREVTAPRVRQLMAGCCDSKGKTVAGLGGGYDYDELSAAPD